MEINEILKIAMSQDASDIFLKVGSPLTMRINGRINILKEFASFTKEEIDHYIDAICSSQQKSVYEKYFDVDFAFEREGLDRFRASIFLQRNLPSIVLRRIKKSIGTFVDLNLPQKVLTQLSCEMRGLVLVTGPAGSGKSTTIASMIEYINQNFSRHIITIEDPIEFVFEDKNSIINQRELGLDVRSYPVALRQVTLQSPDVIFIGTIRDLPTMSAALEAAEMGILVLSTIHTVNSAQTVERILNFFPPYQHDEIRMQLSFLLKGIISMRLIPRSDAGGRIPACEVMTLTPTISRLIRENKLQEIPKFLEDGEMFGMQSFKQSLSNLVKKGFVKRDDALLFADNKEELDLELRGIKRLERTM